jgi:hypothetical protein
MSIDPAALPATIRDLREQVAGILSHLDTAYLPSPARIRGKHEGLPGPEWTVESTRRRRDFTQWRVHAVDGESDAVFFHSPDAMFDQDVEALKIVEARGIAMALLAACEWAERHRPPPPDVPVLATRRNRKT